MDPSEHIYEQTLVYGSYKKQLEEVAKEEAERLQARKLLQASQKEKVLIVDEFQRKKQFKKFRFKLPMPKFIRRLVRRCTWILGDWTLIIIMSVLVAFISFAIDYVSLRCRLVNRFVFQNAGSVHPGLQIFFWISFSVVFVLLGAGFVRITSSKAIGSGIPEIKVILQGVNLGNYFTYKALIAKIVGITAAIAGGLPVGREDSLIHIAAIIIKLEVDLLEGLDIKIKAAHEMRERDLLSIACAAGVSCCYAAPVGGILLSIELMSVYFATANFWRGFFASFCSTTAYRILAIFVSEQPTITTLFRTYFPLDFAYSPPELLIFSLTGIFCGFGGAAYVALDRTIVNFYRSSKILRRFLLKYWIVYPLLVSLTISIITCPLTMGKYMAGDATLYELIKELFTNVTWLHPNITKNTQLFFVKPEINVYEILSVFIFMRFWMTALAETLPIPSGIYFAVFVIGGAFGRLVGEISYISLPNSWIAISHHIRPVLPGVYAVIGAAAFSASITQGLSTVFIVCEMTGQIVLILPLVISVLLAIAVSRTLQPSIYDSIIKLKRLPYLPHFIGTSSSLYTIYAENIMVTDFQVIPFKGNYQDIKKVLETEPKLSMYPLVDSNESMLLMGAISRIQLTQLLEEKIGRRAQLQRAESWLEKIGSKIALKQEVPQDIKISRFLISSVADQSSLPTSEDHKPLMSNEDNLEKKPSDFINGTPLRSILKKSTEESKPKKASKKKITFPEVRIVDLTEEEQKAWINDQLLHPIDFETCDIDYTPLQLLEKTTLQSIHSIFLLLNLTFAYVTRNGKLVGIISLSEVREAVES